MTPEQRKRALDPFGLAKLVKDKVVLERHVWRLLLKVGGMSCGRPPREITTRKPISIKLGAPFLTGDDGAFHLHHLIQAHPKGFRQPSHKAKKWRSTSLMEQVTGIVPQFEASERGKKKAITAAECRELVKATQDIRNVPDKFLTGTQRLRKAMMPKLPKAETLEAIRERHALARGDDQPGSPTGATGKHKVAA